MNREKLLQQFGELGADGYNVEHAVEAALLVASNLEKMKADEDHWITLLGHLDGAWQPLFIYDPSLLHEDWEKKSRLFQHVIPYLVIRTRLDEYALIFHGQTSPRSTSERKELIFIGCSDGVNTCTCALTVSRDELEPPSIADFSVEAGLSKGRVYDAFSATLSYLRLKDIPSLATHRRNPLQCKTASGHCH